MVLEFSKMAERLIVLIGFGAEVAQIDKKEG